MSRNFALATFVVAALVAALSFGANAALAGIIMPSKPADHTPPSDTRAQGCIIDPNDRNAQCGIIDPNNKPGSTRSIVDPNIKPGVAVGGWQNALNANGLGVHGLAIGGLNGMQVTGIEQLR